MVISLAPESEQAAVAPRHIDWTERLLSVRTALYSSAGLATVAFAIGAIVSTPTTDVSSYSADPRVGARHHVTAPATNAGKSLDASARAARTTASEAAASAVTTTATPASDAASKAPSVPTAPKRLATLSVPSIAMKNVDSLVRVSTRTSRESFADQIGTSGGIGASAVGGDASGTPPTLIGQAPMPYFPEALRSQFTEGEVVVRFRVDEHGRVDLASMKVVKTDHELFTLAVRNVLPRFRFEPARSAAPESKARAEWVDWRAEFSVKN